MIDYKHSPQGKIVQQKYADLLSLSRPDPAKPRMSVSNRAKLFSPFAALRGYDNELLAEGRDHMKQDRTEISEEQKGKLSASLQQLQKGMAVTVRYFSDGYYEDITGQIESIDPVSSELKLYSGIKSALGKELPAVIAFEDIYAICKL